MSIDVQIWSDIACPWCFIGKRRFEKALEEFPQRDQVKVTWRSFQLDPTLPEHSDRDEIAYLVETMGMPREAVEQMVEQVGIIDHGHMLFEGPLAELQRHSRGSVTLRLLDPAKAAPILRAHGIAADGGCVTLPPLRDDLLAALVQQLAMNGAGVVELTPHTKTLEEIFLSLTANEEAD